MKMPEIVKKWIQRKYDNYKGEWLLACLSGSGFRLEIPLGIPKESEAASDLAAIRDWVRAWLKMALPGEVVSQERRYRNLGTQSLPERLVLITPEDAAVWADKKKEWQRVLRRARVLIHEFPTLRDCLKGTFGFLAEEPDVDFDRLMDFLAWLASHPHSGLYPRQVPVEGMDSKWLDNRKAVILEFARRLIPGVPGDAGFHETCGLRMPPDRIRLRLLDPDMRRSFGGLSDLYSPIAELSALPIGPGRVLVVENLQTGLALSDLPGCVAVMALGYQVEPLRALGWFENAELFYWGDIDTHGLAILSRARSIWPGFRSLMMDESTLMDHRRLWVTEDKPHSSEPVNLTEKESSLFRKLRSNVLGQNIRLEQERIDWDYATKRIRTLLTNGRL